MKIIPADVSITHKAYRPCKLQKVLEEFQNMDCDTVEVQLSEGEYVNLRSAQSCLGATIKRLKLPMRTSTSQGRLYLYKISPDIPVVYVGEGSPFKVTEGKGGSTYGKVDSMG